MKNKLYNNLTYVRRLLLFSLLSALPLFGQSLEPRLYSNAPRDLNFLVIGYAHTQGVLADNIVPDLADPELNADIAVIAYARFLDVAGQSAKIDVVVPTVCLNGEGIYHGDLATRNVCGLGDVKARFSWNVFGAPALSLKEFASYNQDVLVGLSVQVTAPTGQYDQSKLVNISAHRWAVKPGIGVSKHIADFTLEIAADVEFYTTNNMSFAGTTRKQAPVYSGQIHGIYNFMPGLWFGLDANYYGGGAYTINGIKKDDALNNARYGVTLALPINRYNSIKIYGNTGIFARTGTDFTLLGAVWQYRFGAGL